MPLVRAELRNEYAMGAQELYREANKEDPKEVLEGVAVAGLVGVLRQLGDLAEFAAEVFLGLQEEAMRTSSRSHKLMDRVKRVETSLSPLEKALLAQRSHLHFAYTAGTNWHARILCEQNHFIYSDMPQFILDSYDDSHVPPSLHLLDKFDPHGPGSCMKRYSDPTFFKRVSVASGEAIAYKASKDKKGRKIKKRSRTRSQELSRDASFSHRSGRVWFTQANVDRNHSSSQTASTYDGTQGLNFTEQTTFNLRNSSDYAEGYFHPTNPTQPEEQKFRKSISSSFKRLENDFLDYNFLEGKIIDACDDIHIYTSREPAGYTSSSGTWNEKNNNTNVNDVRSMEPKTKISENDCMTPGNNHTRHSELFFPVLNDESPVCNADDIEIVNSMDSQPHNQVVLAPESTDAPPNDIDSEADHYVDALNTIESECETDSDFTRKKQVEHYPELEDKAVKEEASEVVRHDLECQSLSSDTNILAESSLINDSCDNNLISLSTKSHHTTKSNAAVFDSTFLVDKDLQSSQMARGYSCNAGDDSVPCIISSTIMDDQPQASITNGMRIGPDSQKHVQETSNVTSVTFWSNGDLLGLQPSKPPDFSMLSSPHQGILFEKEGKIGSSTPDVIHSDKAASQTEIFKHSEENPSADSSTSHENQTSIPSVTKTLWKIPPTDLDIKLGKFGDPIRQNNNADIATGSSVNSSRKFEPSNMWLLSEANKKLLLGENKKSSSVAHNLMNAFEQKNCLAVNRAFYGRNKDLFSGESFIMSPPLEHMKLSFQPIDGFETLKLKLKFPDESTESGGDIFPSFQLVPEVSIARPNFGSDSDAETFYRSSPSLSDDSHSNRWSESNSELWESNESPTEKDCDIYDTLRRISVSTVMENGHEEFPFVDNESGNTRFCPLDQALSSSLGKELKNDVSIPKGVVGPQQFVVMHAPPPLPPVQWQKSESSAKGSSYEFGLTHSLNPVSQPKPAPLTEDPIDTMQMQKSKLASLWELNGGREMNQVRSVDEKDFLHQIREKSFNLRPTVTAKPAVPSVASTNVQVTAIIEKANAIRQAVASDGDDDGNWSET